MAEKKGVGHAYNIDFLNVVFAASSLFLFLSVVWMVWDDFDRDWKNTQRQFARLEYQVTQASLQKAASSVDKAKLGQPEINLGLLPGFGGTQRLLRLAGRSAALELCLLGASIDAARAFALGLVNRVVPAEKLDEEVDAIAGQLAASAPHAIAGILDAVLIGGDGGIDAGLDYETQTFALCFSTSDMREGTSAFLERRKPAFSGR